MSAEAETSKKYWCHERAAFKGDSATNGGIALSLRAMDLISESIRSKVTQPILSGDFDLAITAACKAVETRMRERADLPTSELGSRLARKFFARIEATALQHAERRGDLSDEEHLFVGLFGLYRDRAVHEALGQQSHGSPPIDSKPTHSSQLSAA